MAYDNTNTFALFKNDKGDNEKRPDYRGTVNIDGTDFELSGWIKTSKKGDKFIGGKVQPARDRQQRQQPAPQTPPPSTNNAIDEDVPF